MKFPILYEQNETDFFILGLGPLTNSIKATVTEERNGAFYFEGEVLTNSEQFKLLKNDMIIKADAGHTLKNQRFRIKRIVDKHDGVAEIYAEHISYLAQELSLKPEVSIKSADGNGVITRWKNSIIDKNPFVVDSDVTTTASTKWEIGEVDNAREALGGVKGSILDNWGGEYRFDNYHISLLQKRGKPADTLLAYGRNITDFEQERNITNTYTSVFPFARYTDDKQSEHLVTIDNYIVDSKYVDNYPNRKALPVDFSDKFEHEEKPTKEKLVKLAETYIKSNEIGIPKTSIRVSFLDLSKASMYDVFQPLEQLSLCDDVRVEYPLLGVSTVSKVIKTVWNVLTDSYDEIEIGEKRTTLSTTIKEQQEAIKEVEKNVNGALVAANGKNMVFYGLYGENGLGEPVATMIGDMWYKPVGEDIELYIWNGTIWEFIMSTAPDDTIKEKIEELEQTSKDISESVDKALEEAEIARKEAFNSDKLANEAKKDALDAVEKGNKNSIDITKTDNQLKVSAVKIEENTTRITNIKIESDRLSSVMLETQDSLESLKLSSDRNYILGTSDEYKNVNFDGSSTGPTDPAPPEKLVDVQVIGYDEYYNALYTETVKAAEGSDKTFYAKSVTGYETIGQTSKTVKVSSYTKVVFEYKKKDSGGGTPTKEVDVKVQCFDERGLVINSYTEKHEVNTYVTFVAKDINDYELTSSRTQEIYVNENSIVKFNYKKKEEKPPISTIGDNILTGSDKETDIRGAYLSKMEYILYNLAKPANQSGISLNDLVQIEFEVVSKNVSQTGGYMQFAIDNSANLSDYISIDNLPSYGKYTGTFRVSGASPQNSTTRSVLVRVKDFKSGNSIKIKNLTIKKLTQARMNLQLFSNNLSGLVKIGQIDIDERFSNEPNFLVSCYVDTDYDTGLEIILKNSWGSEIKRIKSKDSKRSGFIECEVPYSQNVKVVEVYLANRSNYNYNKGRYKWLQGEIGNTRTPWKLAVEDLASKTKVSSLEQTVDGFQMNVNNSLDGMNGQLTVMSNQINTTVNKVETVDGKVSRQETRITQLSNQLDFKVSANEVISRINMSPERIRIDSKLIHLSGQTLIDDAVIKNAMIANGAIDNAKIQNATISDAKIISITANKVVARDLSAITVNTGALNISGWMSILTDNMGIRGSFDYGDMSDTATFQRWHEGDFSISHRVLAFKGHQWKLRTNGSKGSYHGWSESTYGMNHFKSRLYTNSSTTSLIGRVDIRDDFIQVNDNWVTDETGGTWIKPNRVVTTSLRTYDVSAKPSVNYVYFNENRKDLADFRIGKDGAGKAVVSEAIYKRTYNSQPTMCVTDEGRLGRIVSAKKYKNNIEVANDVIIKAKTVLSIEPKSWEAKNSDSGIRHYGFIADDFHESDLKEVVLYSHDEVEGLSYDRITMYHNVVLSEHEKEIESLKRRIEKLEEELDHAS